MLCTCKVGQFFYPRIRDYWKRAAHLLTSAWLHRDCFELVFGNPEMDACFALGVSEPPCLVELERIQIQEAAKKKPGELWKWGAIWGWVREGEKDLVDVSVLIVNAWKARHPAVLVSFTQAPSLLAPQLRARGSIPVLDDGVMEMKI